MGARKQSIAELSLRYKSSSRRFSFTRFWSMVERKDADSCWKWIGEFNGKYPINSQQMCGDAWAHRIALRIRIKRDIARGMVAAHSCDHTWCCNPRHIEEKTAYENSCDETARGLRLSGENHPNATMSNEDVFGIVEMIVGGMSDTQIGRTMGINRQRVWEIRNGKAWVKVSRFCDGIGFQRMMSSTVKPASEVAR